MLLCTDLHAENVLAAEREPWLVIDPKPYVGDPTYDPLQHMLNCQQRLHTDPRRLGLCMADLLSLNGERLLFWLFARWHSNQQTGRFTERSPVASPPPRGLMWISGRRRRRGRVRVGR